MTEQQDKPVERLKAALGFLKVRNKIAASVPDPFVSECEPHVCPERTRAGLIAVFLDRAQGVVPDLKFSTAVTGFTADEALNLPLSELHALVTRRVDAAMECYRYVKLSETTDDAWLDAELRRTMGV